jgi:hypothetical protein
MCTPYVGAARLFLQPHLKPGVKSKLLNQRIPGGVVEFIPEHRVL